MRTLAVITVTLFGIVAACGGKIDGGVDAGIDASPDSHPVCAPLGGSCNISLDCCLTTVCVANVCTDELPPPSCEPDGASCFDPTECCSHACSGGLCGLPPPPCNPNGAPCQFGTDCCSGLCIGNVCGGASIDSGIGCATTSNKQCDLCVAMSCCTQRTSCESDTTCNAWLSCVETCEQSGFSAFACTQQQCGEPSSTMETALYACAEKSCNTACTTD